MEDMSGQIMYKLASIETKVQNISENLTSAIHRVEDKISETTKDTERKFAKMELRIDDTATRIDKFEDWKNNIVAKISGVALVVGVLWAIFGERIQAQVGHIL